MKPGQELVFSFTDSAIQGNKYTNLLAHKEQSQRKCCLCHHKMKLENTKVGNINVNKMGKITAYDWQDFDYGKVILFKKQFFCMFGFGWFFFFTLQLADLFEHSRYCADAY